jgi:hypothetical protein
MQEENFLDPESESELPHEPEVDEAQAAARAEAAADLDGQADVTQLYLNEIGREGLLTQDQERPWPSVCGKGISRPARR